VTWGGDVTWDGFNPPLTRAADRHPTDKYAMGYYPAYAELAKRIGPAGHVLEIGVAWGGSLEMWQDLFPDGLVAGADHAPQARWPDGTVRIFREQDDPELAADAWAASPEGWDLIVDDASHNGALTEVTFAMLWPLVKPGGWYSVEDWTLGFGDPWTGMDRFGGDSMIRLAESFVRRLEPAPGSSWFDGLPNRPSGSGIAELWYRFGQAMLHKAAA
jgi:hypothetical protein